MSDTNFSPVLVSVCDPFHLHLTALCVPLPFGLQLSVLSLPLLLESPLRLFLDVVTTVCLCFGLIYFNLLGSNNISRPEVRKARKRVNRKLLDVATGKLRIVMLKENKGFFYSLLHVRILPAFLYAHTHTGEEGVLLCHLQHEGLLHACRHKLSLSHAHANIYAPHNSQWFARV